MSRNLCIADATVCIAGGTVCIADGTVCIADGTWNVPATLIQSSVDCLQRFASGESLLDHFRKPECFVAAEATLFGLEYITSEP